MNLVTSDDIFDSWRTLRLQIADDTDNIRNIYQSRVCMSNSLTSTNFFTQRECCCGCSTLKTLMTSYFLNDQREIKVLSGKKKGTVLKIFSRENIDMTIVDGGISVNPFMNYVLVSCIMKKIIEVKSYPVKIPYEWSYVCKGKFNIVLDATNVSSIKDISRLKKLTNSSPLARKTVYNPISSKTVASIFKQIALLTHFYGMYQYTHGEPSITYITFNPSPIKFSYNNKHVDSSLKVSISPSVYSSIVYKNTKFALKKNIHKYLKTYENKDVAIEGKKYSGKYENHKVVYVKIGNKSEQFLKNLINGRCDIDTFDFIMFVSSLMANSQYAASFKDCPYIDIWKNLWRKEDYEHLSKDLSAIQSNCFKNIFDIIKQYYFRIDALEYALKDI
jgi:hypothetical protein